MVFKYNLLTTNVGSPCLDDASYLKSVTRKHKLTVTIKLLALFYEAYAYEFTTISRDKDLNLFSQKLKYRL